MEFAAVVENRLESIYSHRLSRGRGSECLDLTLRLSWRDTSVSAGIVKSKRSGAAALKCTWKFSLRNFERSMGYTLSIPKLRTSKSI